MNTPGVARSLPVVAVGGVSGATLRWGLLELLPADPWAWGVLVANCLGCLLLGVLSARLAAWRDHPLWLAAGAGFCGSLTTFSALAVDIAGSLRDGDVGNGGAYLAATMLAGFGALGVGLAAGRRSA